jgi:hypothetical protein
LGKFKIELIQTFDIIKYFKLTFSQWWHSIRKMHQLFKMSISNYQVFISIQSTDSDTLLLACSFSENWIHWLNPPNGLCKSAPFVERLTKGNDGSLLFVSIHQSFTIVSSQCQLLNSIIFNRTAGMYMPLMKVDFLTHRIMCVELILIQKMMISSKSKNKNWTQFDILRTIPL